MSCYLLQAVAFSLLLADEYLRVITIKCKRNLFQQNPQLSGIQTTHGSSKQPKTQPELNFLSTKIHIGCLLLKMLYYLCFLSLVLAAIQFGKPTGKKSTIAIKSNIMQCSQRMSNKVLLYLQLIEPAVLKGLMSCE